VEYEIRRGKDMKKMIKGIVLVCIAVSLVLGIFACARDSDPKSLAKEWYAIMMQVPDAQNDRAKMDALQKKSQSIQEKIAALSDEDKKIIQAEVARLIQQGSNQE
jgi:hypothetical protein